LDHNGFAAPGPLALLGSASYPVPVRRPAASFPASFTPSSRSDALRFASLAVISSGEDSHLQVNPHAGRTREGRAPAGTRGPLWDEMHTQMRDGAARISLRYSRATEYCQFLILRSLRSKRLEG